MTIIQNGLVSVSIVGNGERKHTQLQIESADRNTVHIADNKYNSNVPHVTAREDKKERNASPVEERVWVTNLVEVCKGVLRNTPLDEWPESLDPLEDFITKLEEGDDEIHGERYLV
jgi:hypothetical protein